MRFTTSVFPALRDISLRTRIVALTVGVTLVTASVLAALFFARMVEAERQIAIRGLRVSGALHAQAIRTVLSRTAEDASILTDLPPIDGIMRAMANPDRIDPHDHSSVPQWQNRLATIFTTILGTRPAYTGLSFIGLSNGIQEFVHVSSEAAPLSALFPSDGPQRPGAPPAPAAPLPAFDMAALRAGEGYFSQGTDAVGAAPGTMRSRVQYVAPVADDNGTLFGAIVISADPYGLIGMAHPGVTGHNRLHVVTGNGERVTYLPDGREMRLFHTGPHLAAPPAPVAPSVPGDGTGTPPDASDGAATAPAIGSAAPLPLGTLAEDGDWITYSFDVLRSRMPDGLAMHVTEAFPRARLYDQARDTLWVAAGASLALVLLAGLVAGVIGARLTRPLRRLQDLLQARAGDHGGVHPLTVDRIGHDEVGDLTRSFVTLTNELLFQTTRSQAILNGAADGIVTIDRFGHIEEANASVSRLFGYPRDALIGRPVEMLMPEADARSHAYYLQTTRQDGFARRMGANRDIRGKHRDGRLIPLEITVSRSDYGGEVHFIGILRDASQRAEAEAQKQELIAALERSNAELDKFAYVASHDLKAPLRVIDNASRWLMEDLEPVLTDDTRESLDLLRSRVARMERLLDDLLRHSRIGRTEDRAVPMPGDEIIDQIRGLLNLPRGMIFEASPAFAEITMPHMPITTILLNLVSNAAKHHDRDTGRISLDVQESDAGYHFTITDDGPGIAPEYHERIFEMFQTLKPRDQVDGSGMGLAMVRKHVDLAGGTIKVISDGSRGTIFELFWPRTPQAGTSEGQAA